LAEPRRPPQHFDVRRRQRPTRRFDVPPRVDLRVDCGTLAHPIARPEPSVWATA
jgi:hypothetical protein